MNDANFSLTYRFDNDYLNRLMSSSNCFKRIIGSRIVSYLGGPAVAIVDVGVHTGYLIGKPLYAIVLTFVEVISLGNFEGGETVELKTCLKHATKVAAFTIVFFVNIIPISLIMPSWRQVLERRWMQAPAQAQNVPVAPTPSRYDYRRVLQSMESLGNAPVITELNSLSSKLSLFEESIKRGEQIEGVTLEDVRKQEKLITEHRKKIAAAEFERDKERHCKEIDNLVNDMCSKLPAVPVADAVPSTYVDVEFEISSMSKEEMANAEIEIVIHTDAHNGNGIETIDDFHKVWNQFSSSGQRKNFSEKDVAGFEYLEQIWKKFTTSNLVDPRVRLLQEQINEISQYVYFRKNWRQFIQVQAKISEEELADSVIKDFWALEKVWRDIKADGLAPDSLPTAQKKSHKKLAELSLKELPVAMDDNTYAEIVEEPPKDYLHESRMDQEIARFKDRINFYPFVEKWGNFVALHGKKKIFDSRVAAAFNTLQDKWNQLTFGKTGARGKKIQKEISTIDKFVNFELHWKKFHEIHAKIEADQFDQNQSEQFWALEKVWSQIKESTSLMNTRIREIDAQISTYKLRVNVKSDEASFPSDFHSDDEDDDRPTTSALDASFSSIKRKRWSERFHANAVIAEENRKKGSLVDSHSSKQLTKPEQTSFHSVHTNLCHDRKIFSKRDLWKFAKSRIIETSDKKEIKRLRNWKILVNYVRFMQNDLPSLAPALSAVIKTEDNQDTYELPVEAVLSNEILTEPINSWFGYDRSRGNKKHLWKLAKDRIIETSDKTEIRSLRHWKTLANFINNSIQNQRLAKKSILKDKPLQNLKNHL